MRSTLRKNIRKEDFEHLFYELCEPANPNVRNFCLVEIDSQKFSVL